MAKEIVLWSGGADSTEILTWLASASSECYPKIALSVTGYNGQINKKQLMGQNAAQIRYLKWANKKGYHIKHERIAMTGSFVARGDPAQKMAMAQPVVWLSAVINVVDEGDTIYMGYNRGSSFWHNRSLFEDAFHAVCRLKGIKAKLEYPLEWDFKADILRKLRKKKVPNNCWFSCDKTEDGKACGECSKCKKMAEAKKHWRYKHEKDPSLKDEKK